MQDRTRVDARWGLQTGLAIGALFGVIALLGFWISPQEFQQHVAIPVVLELAAFLAAGLGLGVALSLFKHAKRARGAAALVVYVAALPLSASALVASHGTGYLHRTAHWLVIAILALAAPAIAATLWPERD